MTANHAHTPSTEHVRFIYSLDGADREYKAQEFDRWLTAEIAAAEQRGAEAALTDFRRFATRVMPPTVTRKDVITGIEVALKRLSQDRYLLMGPLRADLLEGDDE